MGEANGKSSTFCYKITSVTSTDCVPPVTKQSQIAYPVHVPYPIQRLPFHSISFHHPLPCTSQGVWMWISAHSHRGKGVNTRLPCFHLPSCKSAGWICWNYRWECSQCRVRVWVTHRSWFTWSSSWRNVAGSSRRMIRENTEFPLDAILKEESDLSPVLREFGRFRCPT